MADDSKKEIERKVRDRYFRDMYKEQNRNAYIHWPIILTIPFFFISGGGLWAVIVLWVGYFLAVHFQTEKDMADLRQRDWEFEKKEEETKKKLEEEKALEKEFVPFKKDIYNKFCASKTEKEKDFYWEMYSYLQRHTRWSELSKEQQEYLQQNEYVKRYGSNIEYTYFR